MSSKQNFPWFKFYPGDWIAGTSQLMAVERGIYMSLLAHMYDTGGGLKYEPKRLSMICGCSRQQLIKTVDLLLVSPGKLKLEDGFITNERVKSELETAKKLSQSASESAQARWKKTNKNKEGTMRSHQSGICETDASQNIDKRKYSETSSLRTKENSPNDDAASEPDPKPKPKKKTGTRLDPDWNPGSQGAEFARSKGLTNEQIKNEFDKFKNYWTAKAGQGATKLDWMATWRNWIINSADRYGSNPPISGRSADPTPRLRAAMRAAIPPNERG